MGNQFQLAGAQETRPVHLAPISTNRFFQGLWTQRNPLRDGGSTRIEEKFYGSRGDAMIDGSNVEISNRLTPVRRPGLSSYNSQHFTGVDYFYEFRQFTTTSETIKVMVDTTAALYDGTGPSTKNLVWTKSAGAGQTYMQDVANTLYFGNGVDQKKWMQPAGWTASSSFAIGNSIIDSNSNLQYLTQVVVGSVVSASGGGFSISGKYVTITFVASPSFIITPGMTFQVFGFVAGSYLNGVRLVASIVSGNVVTAFFDHPNVAFTAENSTTVITSDVGTIGTSGAVTPVWALGGTTADGVLVWVTGGTIPVFNWGVAAPTQAPSVLSGTITANSSMTIWQPNTSYPVIGPQYILANTGAVWFISNFGDITAGRSGPSYPQFDVTVSPTLISPNVQDGTMTWGHTLWLGSTNTAFILQGPVGWTGGTSTITASSGQPLLCVDSNGNLQGAYTIGVTGIVAPTWNATYGGATVDNTVTWTNLGPYLARAFSGWKYGYAYYAIDGSLSTLSPLTVSTTGVIDGVAIQGQYAPDPQQVVAIWIFRTTDGGSTPLFLAAFSNLFSGTFTFIDQHPDSDLDVLVVGPQAEANNPPPTGLINLTYHLGRIFGSVQNVVRWSAGPDIGAGNPNTAWPPNNFATFPSRVTRIVPTSSGAFVFTISDIYLIVGLGTNASPLFSTPYATGIGLLSYNALAVNGTLVYLFTSDSQLIALDPSSGISQVGFPIGDQFQLSNWNPNTTYVTWHVSGSQDHALYVSDGSTGWFRMTPTASPESGLTWSPFATITNGLKAVQSIEVSPGIHQLLVGPSSSGAILKRDLSVFQDNGVSYTAFFTVGSLVLANPGQVAELSFITTDAKLVGSSPTPSVLLDEISGNFDFLPNFTQDPPQLPKSATTYNQRFYFSQTGSPAICRHLQVKISWPAENFQNELYTMTIFGGFMQED